MKDYFGQEIRVGDIARLISETGTIENSEIGFRIFLLDEPDGCVVTFTDRVTNVPIHIRPERLAICPSSVISHTDRE